MNTFMNQLRNDSNYKYTENGAVAHRTTNNPVYDMFALGAAYRSRSDADCILLFKEALKYDAALALKCLFYIRDCRGGQGERRFFRVCIKWLAENDPNKIRHLLQYIPEYGRYDDWFEFFGTSLEEDIIALIRDQLMVDMLSEKNAISLLAKWMPSENASSATTIQKAKKIRNALSMTSKEYRQMLSKLREKINVLERLMSLNQWDKIEFDKIPSKAGLIYKNAFARRDIIAKKYEAFAKNKNTTVNASTLYPYEVVSKALKIHGSNLIDINDTNRLMINKYWENLPDYFNGESSSLMCVVDTSASMRWSGREKCRPIDVAISLGMYCAERLNGPFKDNYISFSSAPQLIHVKGVDFVDKVSRIYQTNLCQNTNLTAVFELLLNIALRPNVNKKDIPKTIVIISDMEIDEGSLERWDKNEVSTEMEKIRKKWVNYGLEMPKLVYWNVDARNDTILDSGTNVSFVSGASPIIFKQVLTGKTGWDLCLEALLSERYVNINIINN